MMRPMTRMLWIGVIVLIAVSTYLLKGWQSDSYQGIPNSVTGKPIIIDGDTVRFDGVAGFGKIRVRLQGMDAPEMEQSCKRGGAKYPCGKDSHQALLDFVGDKDVTCIAEGVDQYKRMIGRCSVDGLDMGHHMVKNGHAVAYRRYDDTYIADEDSARANRLGLWSGQFVLPEKWRRGERLP